jgi:hypothetical protein
VTNKYKTKTIKWEKSLSLMLLHGTLQSAGPGDKTNTTCGIRDSNNQRRKEYRRLKQ